MNLETMKRTDLEAAFVELQDWCSILTNKLADKMLEAAVLKAEKEILADEVTRLHGDLTDEYWKNEQYREAQEALDRYASAWQ